MKDFALCTFMISISSVFQWNLIENIKYSIIFSRRSFVRHIDAPEWNTNMAAPYILTKNRVMFARS